MPQMSWSASCSFTQAARALAVTRAATVGLRYKKVLPMGHPSPRPTCEWVETWGESPGGRAEGSEDLADALRKKSEP